jgi:peptide-methionine (S)-S-oxide reductase
MVNTLEIATLAGGCFWCLEAIFENVRGVSRVESGYCGGHVQRPSYEEVCSETTGHAESIQVTFDRHVVSYEDLLTVFFVIHNPTTLNYQGYDVGSRYRSVIFYSTPEQESVAKNTIAKLEEDTVWNSTIVTEVKPLTEFYPAEDYHQQYYKKNTDQPYCQIIIAPKLSKFLKEHLDKLKPLV